jgi:hypothetical protein
MCLAAILDIDPARKTLTIATGFVLPLAELDLIVVRCPNAAVLKRLSEELDSHELPVWSKTFVFAGFGPPTGVDHEHCALLACGVEDAEAFGRMLIPLCSRLGVEVESAKSTARAAS